MSPSPKRCAERERLIDLLKAANQELTDIHQAEIVAALIGNLAGFESLRPSSWTSVWISHLCISFYHLAQRVSIGEALLATGPQRRTPPNELQRLDRGPCRSLYLLPARTRISLHPSVAWPAVKNFRQLSNLSIHLGVPCPRDSCSSHGARGARERAGGGSRPQ